MGGNFRVSFLEVALIMVIVLVMASFTPFGTEVPAFNDGAILPMDDGEAVSVDLSDINEAVSVGLSDTNVDAGSGYENSGNSYTYPGVYVPGSGRFIFVDGSEEISVRLDEISDILSRCLEFMAMGKRKRVSRQRECDLVIDIQKLIEKLEIIRGER